MLFLRLVNNTGSNHNIQEPRSPGESCPDAVPLRRPGGLEKYRPSDVTFPEGYRSGVSMTHLLLVYIVSFLRRSIYTSSTKRHEGERCNIDKCCRKFVSRLC